MAWLVRDGTVLATVEVADTRSARRRGLLGRDAAQVDGALLLRPARSVHSLGMRFALDVAFLDDDLVVVALLALLPGRVTRPRRRARAVLEAAAGAFASWDLHVGDHLEVRGGPGPAGAPGAAGPGGGRPGAGP